jgi:hypothetical protein
MSYVIAAPEIMTSAATDLAGIGSSLSEANTAAAASTTEVIPAAADEVSAAIASLFSSHGTAFHALSAQAATFHSRFVQALNSAEGTYAAAEAANAGPLQTLAHDLPVPSVAISVSGFKLLQLGSATATSGTGDLAIALGRGSVATATGGIFNTAVVVGPGSSAFVGSAYSPFISSGYLNLGVVVGPDSSVSAGPGNLNLGVVLGGHSLGGAGLGNLDVGFVLGNDDVARSGGGITVAVEGGTISAGETPGSLDVAFAWGTGSTADAGASGPGTPGNHDLAAVFGNMQTATATGANRLVDIVTPFGTAGGAAGTLVPNVAAADPSLLDPNVAISAFGHPLAQFGTAHASSGFGGLAVAVGANSDATTSGVFNCAFALGAGSDATVNAGPVYYLGVCEFDTAIAVGTNDVAVAGGSPVPPPYPPGGPVPALSFLPRPGSFDTAAVFGNMLTATATGANGLVDIVTPFGTL